jgi:hypothetical protein
MSLVNESNEILLHTIMSSTGLTSEEKCNCKEIIRMRSVPRQEHHNVTVNEAHYSKVHLGFSSDAWVELFTNYIKNRTNLNVDFSVPHTGDTYMDMWMNIPYYDYVVDIECALRDFLREKGYLFVEYKDISKPRINFDISFTTWMYMLRKYMTKYHSDIELDWCEHIRYPNSYCTCEEAKEPDMSGPNRVYIDVLTMLCDHHAYREWSGEPEKKVIRKHDVEQSSCVGS